MDFVVNVQKHNKKEKIGLIGYKNNYVLRKNF